MDKNRIQWIDLTKAFAIFLVVVLHVSAPILSGYNILPKSSWLMGNFYNSFGRIGVPLFVMISGFLLLRHKEDEPIKTFFGKRFKRILLPFLSWSFIYFLWSNLSKNQDINFANFLEVIYKPQYYHLWFMYMIIGLYLITPVLRAVIKNGEEKITKYLMFLLTGYALLPLLFQNTLLIIIPNVFVLYFVLGFYLGNKENKNIRKSYLIEVYLICYVITFLGTLYLTQKNNGVYDPFFHESTGPILILMTICVFMLLKKITINNVRVNRFIEIISKNSFGIYLSHILVIVTLDHGIFGIGFGWNSMNPLLSIPLLSISVFSISFLLVFILGKIPLLRRILV